jgi:hypothetical protein
MLIADLDFSLFLLLTVVSLPCDVKLFRFKLMKQFSRLWETEIEQQE